MVLEITIPVLKRKKYAFIAVIAGALMAALFYYLTVINVAYKSISIFSEMNGLEFTIFSLLLSLVIAILFGIYLGLLIFRQDIIKDKKNPKHFLSGTGGTAAGIIGAGCPSCGAPLFAFFGAPMALLALPFRGLEIKILSILLILLSIYLLAQSIEKKLRC